MKKTIIFIFLLFISCSLFGCKKNKDNDSSKNGLTTSLKNEKKAAFNFFWETQQTSGNAYGLIPDRYPNNGLASIASVGFGLAAIVVGVDSKYITYEEAEERVYNSLVSLEKLERVHGFYYHFYNYYSAKPSTGSEISVIDTALYIGGALTAAEYFGGRVKEIANRIYQSIEWNWYVNPNTHRFYMSYDPTTNSFSGAWDFYAEQLILYFLGAGSNNYATGKTEYDSFTKKTGNYGGFSFIHSWFGSLFTHQFSHAFIDFRNYNDSEGINWFENSVNATLASQKYAIDLSKDFVTVNEFAFGFTACDGPKGYNGLYGSKPSGGGFTDTHVVDGTIPPAGALGSIVFAPEIVKKSCNYYANLLDGGLIGEYGFYDAYNLEGSSAWIGRDVIGIDKGITLLMIANYENEIIWKNFMKNDFIENAFSTLGFSKK